MLCPNALLPAELARISPCSFSRFVSFVSFVVPLFDLNQSFLCHFLQNRQQVALTAFRFHIVVI